MRASDKPQGRVSGDSALTTQQYVTSHPAAGRLPTTKPQQPQQQQVLPAKQLPASSGDATSDQFQDAYKAALKKKGLFKEYLSRHSVVDGINSAMQSLFEQPELPDNPLQYLGMHMIKHAYSYSSPQQPQQQQQQPKPQHIQLQADQGAHQQQQQQQQRTSGS
jgi:hypothetical protein